MTLPYETEIQVLDALASFFRGEPTYFAGLDINEKTEIRDAYEKILRILTES